MTGKRISINDDVMSIGITARLPVWRGIYTAVAMYRGITRRMQCIRNGTLGCNVPGAVTGPVDKYMAIPVREQRER